MTYTPIPAGTPDWDVPVNAAFTDQDTRITANAAAIGTNDSQIAALQLNDAAQDAAIAGLEANDVIQDGDIATLQANDAVQDTDIDNLQTLTTTHTSQISTLQTQSAQVRNGNWLPSDQGMVAWSYDPSEAANNQTLTSGTVVYVALPIREATSFTNIVVPISVAGATLTAGQNLVGLYNSAGTRVAVSADQAANWTTTGVKTVPMVGAPIALSPGMYFLAYLSVGTTPITILRESNITNANLINYNLTTATARVSELAGQTSLTSTVTLSSRTLSLLSTWAGIS